MNRRNITTFEEARDYIDGIPKFTAKNTMEDTKAFLHRLGDPDAKMHIIHVAGTNGKGSVCAYLSSILRTAGYRTALFTSPHLVDVRERVIMDGEMISREDFLRFFLKIYGMLDWKLLEEGAEKAYHPSYFEFLFFIAMAYFAEKQPEFCVLETGLGGRLDATNSVGKKDLSVITHISLDHVEYLGNTVESIASEKAGILHSGVPAVYWDTCPETTAVLKERASELGILTYSVSENDYSFSNFNGKSIDFSLRTGYYGCIDLCLHTIAAYQMENCALAIRAIETLKDSFCNIGKIITAEHIKKGAADCFWAGRMEEVLPQVYVDGAHNEDGIRAFLETVAADGCGNGRNLLFSVVKDKDYESMMRQLADSGLFGKIAVAHMGNTRALAGEKLEELTEKYPGCGFEIYGDVAAAFRKLLEDQQGERIYVAGSLYLAGEIKELVCDDKFRGRIKKISSQP